jgi:hypothetical protein
MTSEVGRIPKPTRNTGSTPRTATPEDPPQGRERIPLPRATESTGGRHAGALERQRRARENLADVRLSRSPVGRQGQPGALSRRNGW